MTERDELREHNFDGIQEYDNDLPKWWVWLFWITIIFSVIYPFVYDFGPGQFASQSIDQEMAQYREERELVSKAAVAGSSAESLFKLTTDSSALETGAKVYTTRCMVCHADKGQGLIGPNLTDEYWIHGGSIIDIQKVVVNGVIEKGMLAWKDQLSSSEIDAVVAYIWTLYGTNPPNPKAAQGDKVVR